MKTFGTKTCLNPKRIQLRFAPFLNLAHDVTFLISYPAMQSVNKKRRMYKVLFTFLLATSSGWAIEITGHKEACT